MAAISTPAREPGSGAGLGLAVGALALIGALLGVGLVVGELQAFWVGLSFIAGLLILYDFRIGAVLLAICLPIASSTLFPSNLFGITGANPLNMLMGVTLLSFLLHGRVSPRAGPVASPRLLWLYVVPILFAGFLGSRHVNSIHPELYELMAIDFTNATGYLRDMMVKPLFTVVIAVLIGAAVARAKKPEGFLIPIGIAIWFLCLMSIKQVARTSLSLEEISNPRMRTFFSSTGLHANDLGRVFAVAYAFLLFAWWESKDRLFKLTCLATMALVVMALIFTFSRGAFLGFVVVNGLFFLWKFNLKTTALFLLAGVAFFALLPPEMYTRLSMGFGQDANAVSAGRIEGIWLPMLSELWRSPIWGNGLGSFMWSEPMLSGQTLVATHPHNAYLEAYLDLGLVGLALVLAYYWHVWKGLRTLGNNAFLSPELRGFYKGAAAALISFFVTGLAGSSLMPRPEYALLWIAIGMMYGQFARRPER
jgi:O-antigen ligase